MWSIGGESDAVILYFHGEVFAEPEPQKTVAGFSMPRNVGHGFGCDAVRRPFDRLG